MEVGDFAPDGSATVSCGRCQTRLKVNLSLELQGTEDAQAEMASSANPSKAKSPDLGSILIAVDGEVTREMIRDLLTDGGYRTIESTDGKDAMALLRSHRSGVALIDVGLSEILGFQLCEQIKHDPDLKETIVILIASIYDKTKYKRQPDSLYGAEDYIERHQLQDDLLLKIKNLLHGTPKTISVAATAVSKPPAPSRAPAQPVRSEPPEKKVAPPTRPSSAEANPEREAARRLARIIVADVALYNQKSVDEGIRNGTFVELLKNQLEEGRRHFDSRIPEQVRSEADYYGLAIEEFIEKRKQTMR